MGEFVKTKQWRTIPFGLMILLLSTSGSAQDESQTKEALGAKKRSLELKLRVLTPVACVGGHLKLRLELTNVSQEAVKLNRAYFWNVYAISPSRTEGENKDKDVFFSWYWPRSTSEDIFLLAPGKTYIAHSYWTTRWALDAEAAKLEAGRYTLEIKTYGHRSKGQFELHNCEQKESRSRNEH